MELFGLPENQNSANFVAGRSCACVDRTGNGRYGVMVANYGGPMRLFEASAGRRRGGCSYTRVPSLWLRLLLRLLPAIAVIL